MRQLRLGKAADKGYKEHEAFRTLRICVDLQLGSRKNI